MKYLLAFVFFVNLTFSQKNKFNIKSLNDKDIYFVCRSTKYKSSIIKEFNEEDKLITHVGIGFKTNNKFLIYNVSNFKKNEKNSSLIKESLKDFISEKDITYYSIWKVKLSQKDKTMLLNSAEFIYDNTIIDFDYDFDLDTKEQLYCSEFIYDLFIKNKIFSKVLKPKLKKLNGIYAMQLGEFFKYIPVDFFLKIPNIKLIYQETIN
jgi:hypothetical protein